MNEQQSSNLCCQMSVRSCTGSWHSGGQIYYQGPGGTCPSVGDVINVGNGQGAIANNPVGFVMAVQQTNLQCWSNYVNMGIVRTFQILPASTNCPRCCQWTTGFGGPSGACHANCGGSQPTNACPGWSGYSNWESNFTSLPNFTSSNPNQPCQFLCQRNTQWSNQIQNVGPNWAAQLQCKIDKVQDLMQTHNCASSNAPAC